ncbi:MarR family transcriptional regulator [Paenibacillus zeisoli]|uniref:MarR family transcriptional regulator n=1 Tax=Paenibacillus zeisoli TaxID=2496267 RepID=A0A3S1D2P6_9BACL|nr:MarR family transcriptional regulator [Paenibacillus zeisoli]RUT35597.1 MarR family transcriptional regulator [Paenibacillus zeisoli]
MARKLCLFCDEIVPIEAHGDSDRFIGCHCSPDGYYSLKRSSYTPIQNLSHILKRQMFPVISAYIREKTDLDQKVSLTLEDMDSIMNSAEIPVTIEDKGTRFLLYLYRHSDGAGHPVTIRPLSKCYNLTYSPNLQELVYIIDKLRGEELIEREGGTFKLTDKGWSEAAARSGGRKLKSCYVLLPDHELMRTAWAEKILPRLEQCGYSPILLHEAWTMNRDMTPGELVSDSKLVIADITSHSPAVYFAAGIAEGLNIQVIWTVKQSEEAPLAVPSQHIRPMVYELEDELAAMLQQKLISKTDEVA